jgi:class 3 adenylate cyclase
MAWPRSRIAHQLERLGTFSPLARLGADTAGARALLVETQYAAERALHVARGAFLAVVFVAFTVQIGRMDDPPAALVAAVVLAFGLGVPIFWMLVWRLMMRPEPPPWLPYALVLVDAWVALRGAIFVQTRFYAALGAERYLSPAELAAVSGPILALVAITGAFRLVPRVAAYSTAVAVLSHAYIAGALGVSWNLGVLTGAVIAFTGLLGVQVARVFRHTMLKAREQAVLERYVPEALMEELARTGDPAASGREAEITIVIVDIRGYTRRAERLTPREAVAFLNDYFSVVVTPLAVEGAVLDKYVGDGVFAFLEGPDQQRRALRAARAILAAVVRYNRERPRSEPVAIGIALHTGRALVGTIGAEQKREYTAIADAVNLAARLEELNKVFGSSVVASEAVLEAVSPEERIGFVGPVTAPIRGHEASLAVRYLPAAGAGSYARYE